MIGDVAETGFVAFMKMSSKIVKNAYLDKNFKNIPKYEHTRRNSVT